MSQNQERRIAATMIIASFLLFSLFSSTIQTTGFETELSSPAISPPLKPTITIINGDWNIIGDQTNESEVILLTGNLTIEYGGNLTFKNVTLIINCSVDGQYHIEVKRGGTLTILDLDNDNTTTEDNSNITAYNNSFEYGFWIMAGSNFTMKNGGIHECGYGATGWKNDGFYLNSNNSFLEGVTIDGGGNRGVVVNKCNARISKSSITTLGGTGIYVVDNAKIWLNDSIIWNLTSGDGLMVQQSSKAFLKDSRIVSPSDDCIAIWIDSTLYMDNVTLDAVGGGNYGIAGLGLTPSSVFAINSTIKNTDIHDIRLTLTDAVTVNTTFNESKIDMTSDSSLTVKNYLHIYVIDNKTLAAIQDAEIEVKDVNKTGYEQIVYATPSYGGSNLTTNSVGLVKWIVVTDKIYYDGNTPTENYTFVNVSKSGYSTGFAEVNMGVSKTVVITLQDMESPALNHTPLTSAKVNEPIDVTVNVTDNSGAANVMLYYQNVGDLVYTPLDMVLSSGNPQSGDWTATIPAQTMTGTVHYFIWANDTSGNAKQTGNYSIQIYDVTAPVIDHTPPTSVPMNAPIIITASVADDVGVDTVLLHYVNVGDVAYTQTVMTFGSGNWTATIPAQTKTGFVHYFIWATDTSGNNVTSPAMGTHSVRITGPPSITITGPKGGEIFTGGGEQLIEFTASDTEDSPGGLIVFLNYTLGTGDVFIEQVTGASSSYNWLLPKINATDVKINATVIDSHGNKAYADSPMFTIDSTPPRIVSTSPANNTTGISIHQPIVIRFSEPMNISSIVMNQTNGTDPGGWQWFWNTEKDTLTGIHNAWPRGETIEITVHAGYMDASEPGNANDTAFVFTFTTETNPLPEIIHENVSGPIELGDAIRINATITDDGTVMNVVLWWRDVDGNWRESQMQKTGDDWFYVLPGQMAEGKVRYQINATDDLGQKNTTVIYEFDIEDSTPPIISHAPVANAIIGEPINITCLVTDLGGVDAVYLHHRNDTAVNFTQAEMNPGFWYLADGITEYYIRAVDVYGNEAVTGAYIVEMIDLSDATPPEVLFVSPIGSGVPVTTSISIVFTEAVDWASVEGAITVSPTITGITYTWLNDQTLIVSFNALQYNTTYTVTIGTGAADLAGNALASAYSWQFTTATEPETVHQPTPNNWGWIGIIIFLIVIIALMLLYLFQKEKKEPDDTIKE